VQGGYKCQALRCTHHGRSPCMCVSIAQSHPAPLLAFACPCVRRSLLWGPVSHLKLQLPLLVLLQSLAIRCWEPARADGSPPLQLRPVPAPSTLPRRLKGSAGLVRGCIAVCSTSNDRRRTSAPRCRECIAVSSPTGEPRTAINKHQQRVDGRGCQQTARELRQALRRPVVLLLCVPPCMAHDPSRLTLQGTPP